MNSEDDFDFILPNEDKNKRQAYRCAVPGLEAWLPQRELGYAVKDLSASGMALQSRSPGDFKQGQAFSADLLLRKKLYLSGVGVRVRRVLPSGLVGCTFVNLDTRHEASLDKLVLEVQKRIIALKKAKSEKEQL